MLQRFLTKILWIRWFGIQMLGSRLTHPTRIYHGLFSFRRCNIAWSEGMRVSQTHTKKKTIAQRHNGTSCSWPSWTAFMNLLTPFGLLSIKQCLIIMWKKKHCLFKHCLRIVCLPRCAIGASTGQCSRYSHLKLNSVPQLISDSESAVINNEIYAAEYERMQMQKYVIIIPDSLNRRQTSIFSM